MKYKLISIITILMLYSCSERTNKNVTIKTNCDTVLSGNMYVAELYVPFKQSILPDFYIIKEKDTLGLEIDTIKGCAIFRSIRKSEGEKVFNGFVDYVNLNGKRKTETFTFKYYVKSGKY